MLTVGAETEDPSIKELLERVSLMESLIEQGREATRRWGEFAVLWGSGSIIAAIAVQLGFDRAWLFLQIVCIPITLLLLWRRKTKYVVATQSDRFVDILWLVTGVTMSGVSLMMGSNPLLGPRGMEIIMYLLLGLGNMVNGLTLRWPLQICVAAMWFTSALISLRFNTTHGLWLYCGTVFVAEVVFGIYLMITEERTFYV